MQDGKMEYGIEGRIDELEIRVAFQDDAIDALNKVITAQDKRIKLLEEAIRHLYQEVKERQPADESSQAFNPVNEVPPHY